MIKHKRNILFFILIISFCYIISIEINSNQEVPPTANLKNSQIVHYYDFEDNSIGGYPFGYTLEYYEDSPGSAVSIDTLGDDQGRCVKLSKTGSGEWSYLMDYFNDNSSVLGNVSFKFYKPDSSGYQIRVYGINSESNPYFPYKTVLTIVMYQGKIYNYQDSAWGYGESHTLITTYEEDKWNNVTISWNSTKGWTFWLNNVVYGINNTLDLSCENPGNAFSVQWASGYSGTGYGHYYIDDINYNNKSEIELPDSSILIQPQTNEINLRKGDNYSINWSIFDNNLINPTYEIYKNNSLYQSGIWENGKIISLDLRDFDVGNYNITLIVDDGAGERSQSQIIVTIENSNENNDENRDNNNLEYVFLSIVLTLVILLIIYISCMKLNKKNLGNDENLISVLCSLICLIFIISAFISNLIDERNESYEPTMNYIVFITIVGTMIMCCICCVKPEPYSNQRQYTNNKTNKVIKLNPNSSKEVYNSKSIKKLSYNEKNLLVKFKKIIKISNKVRLSTIAKSLEISKEGLFEKLLDWGEFLPFKIEGDFLLVENVNEFTNSLDTQFEKWNREEDSKITKK